MILKTEKTIKVEMIFCDYCGACICDIDGNYCCKWTTKNEKHYCEKCLDQATK